MQDPIRCFAERVDDDAGIRYGFSDDSGIGRPAGANQTSARSEASGSADILRGITDHKTICQLKVMFRCRTVVKYGIGLLARTRVGKPMRAHIRPDNEGSLHLETGREISEPDLELWQREKPLSDTALDRYHRADEASCRESRNRLDDAWNQRDIVEPLGLQWFNQRTV